MAGPKLNLEDYLAGQPDWMGAPIDPSFYPQAPPPPPRVVEPMPDLVPEAGGSLGGYDERDASGPQPEPVGNVHAPRRGPLQLPVGPQKKRLTADDYDTPDPPKPKGEEKKPGALAPLARGKSKAEPNERDKALDAAEGEYLAKHRGGGGRRKPGLEVSGMTQERRPGETVIPEIRWALGLEKRPDLGEELDPDVALDVEDPSYRKVETETERFGDKQADRARLVAQQEHAAQQEAINNQMRGLSEEAGALDENLAAIADRRKRLDTMREAATQSAEEARNLEPRTHEQVWQSKGVLGRIMGTLAMAIGGYVQGLGRNGGRNPAADIINKQIDDAVDDEREKAQRADKKAGQKQSDYERAFALYGDPEVAMLQSKLRKITNVQAMLDQRSKLKGLDQGAQERIAELQEGARMKAYEYVNAIENRFNGQVLNEKLTYSQPKPTGGGGAATALGAMQAKAAMRKAYNEANGIKENAPADAATASLDKRQANLQPVKQMLARYKNDDKIPGIKDFNIASKAGRSAVDWVVGEGTASSFADSDEERRNRAVVGGMVSSYISELSGSGVSDKEYERLKTQALQARTKADIVNFVNAAESAIAEQRRLGAGGAPDEPTERSSGERTAD